MLVLSRHRDESVVIDHGRVVVTVLEVRRDGNVRLGFEAPKDVPIHRKEVQDEIDGRGPGSSQKAEG